jgi:hypothetical protein
VPHSAPTTRYTVEHATLYEPNRWLLALTLAPLGVAAYLATGAHRMTHVGQRLLINGLAITLFAAGYVWQRNPRPFTRAVRVEVDGGTLRVGGRAFPVASLKAGFLKPGSKPHVVLRRGLGASIEIEVPSQNEARSLLRALGLDTSQTVAVFQARSRAYAERWYPAVAVVLFGAAFLGAGALRAGSLRFVIAGAAVVALFVAFLWPTRVTVGADGVVLRWLGRDRFLGYGDVDHVARFDEGVGNGRSVGVRIVLRSGEIVRVPLGSPTFSADDVVMLDERLCEAIAAFRAGDAAGDAALLARGERPVGEWVAALRALGAGSNADHRTAPVPRERLLRLVESPSATASERAAAAAALGGALDDDARERLRRAAEASAAPKLRVALEAAADEARAAELEAALGDIEEEASERRARG